LERRLLDIGEDDSRLEKLQRASAALAVALEAEPHLAVPFALVGADDTTPDDDPMFGLAHKAIMEVWATYRNKYQDAPTEIWRALLLDALATRGAVDAAVASAAALTLASVLPRLELGRDGDVVVALYNELRRLAEARAVADWSDEVPTMKLRVQKPKPSTNGTTAKAVKLDKDRLAKLWIYAAGPHDQSSVAPFKEPNPHWPNQGPPWSYEFAPRAATAVAEVVNTALEEVAKAAATSSDAALTQLGQWAEKTGDLLRQAVTAVSQGAAGVQRRSALLWWRSALFSPTIGRSYRTTPVTLSALQMAIDLHVQVPAYAPESVEHFLREAVRDLVRTADSETSDRADPDRASTSSGLGSRMTAVTVDDALAAAAAVEGLPDDEEPSPTGRTTLLGLLTASASGTILGREAVAARLGPAGEGSMAVDELAAWLFRDLQARVVVVEEGGASDDADGEGA
jgi:hypothetical protein